MSSTVRNSSYIVHKTFIKSTEGDGLLVLLADRRSQLLYWMNPHKHVGGLKRTRGRPWLEFHKFAAQKPRADWLSIHRRTTKADLKKKTPIRRMGVRKTSVSRQHRDPVEGAPLKSPVHHGIIVLRDLKVTLNWESIMRRDASLLDSQCKIFQSGTKVGC